MIIADKILQLRKKHNLSQEELAEKLDVSRQSVSKWESANSIPDVSKIIAMSKIFGVATDYLLIDELEIEELSPSEEKIYDNVITLELAKEILAKATVFSKKISIAVIFFILSPLALIYLTLNSQTANPILTENEAVAFGFIALFMLALLGTAISIISYGKASDFDYISTGNFELSYGVEGVIREKKNHLSKNRMVNVAIAVSFFFIGVAIFLALILLSEENTVGVANSFLVLFPCSAIGTFLLVRNEMPLGYYDRLLKEGEFKSVDTRRTDTHDDENKKYSPVGKAILEGYWIIITGLYLLISFLTGSWHITWIIWLISPVPYLILDAAFRKK